MKKILAIFVLAMLVSPLALALTVKQNEEAFIHHPIRVNGAVDSSLTVNITIKDPENVILVSFAPMTYNSTAEEHSYTLTPGQTTKLGTYNYDITATDGELNATSTFELLVTPGGTDDGSSGSFILLAFALVLSLGLIIFGFHIQDPTMTMLGGFGLFFMGLFMFLNGLGNYRNDLTLGLSTLTMAVAFYISTRTGLELMNA